MKYLTVTFQSGHCLPLGFKICLITTFTTKVGETVTSIRQN